MYELSYLPPKPRYSFLYSSKSPVLRAFTQFPLSQMPHCLSLALSAKPRSNSLFFLEFCSASPAKIPHSLFFGLIEQRGKVLPWQPEGSSEDGFFWQLHVLRRANQLLPVHCFPICKMGHPGTIPTSTICNPISLTFKVSLRSLPFRTFPQPPF